MNDIVGIDLGTTNSLIGIMEAGFPILVADEQGERLTPSVVHFPPTGAPLVGRTAWRTQALHPTRTITSIKRFMGARASDVESNDVRQRPYRVRQSATDDGLVIEIQDDSYSPEQISALILRKLKDDAERALGREVTRAVITVPAYFNDGQRNATRRAGETAGFTVERIVNEPTAAALAYGLRHLKEHAKIAVYDFGGGTFDVSILEHTSGVYEVLATNGNTRLGGDDIDQVIVRHLMERLSLPPDPTLRARLAEAVVAAKHRLSSEETATISVPFAEDERHILYEFSRKELEELSRPIVEETRLHCTRVLADAGLGRQDLAEVVLVGGTTRMPLVRQWVQEFFGKAPNTSQHPDEAVALGATIQAGILTGAVQNVVLLDVTPLSLGIETFGGLMHVIIPRNSTIPTKAGEMFTTAVSNQRAVSIKVLQGEREIARDNWELGNFQLDFEPAPKGVPRIGVQFEIDADGILQVLARDTGTGQEKRLDLKSAIDVSDDAVEAMLADSLEHAFADMSKRVWTETELKAREMLAAVESALPFASEGVSESDRREIVAAAERVQRALTTRDVEELQRANAALEQATETLAAAVIERALTSLPSKKPA